MLGSLIVGIGIVLTVVSGTLGLWKAAEGARIGSRSTHEAEAAIFDESMDMDELQGDYIKGMGMQAAGVAEVAITFQAAVAPDFSLATPGLSEGITFGALLAERFEEKHGDDPEDAENSDADDEVDATTADVASPAVAADATFAGVIFVDITNVDGNQGSGSITINVAEDGSVSGTLANVYESGTGSSYLKVDQSGTITGSIDSANTISASGPWVSEAVDGDGDRQTDSLTLVVTATPTDENLTTWKVIVGSQGGETTTLTGIAQ